MTILYLVFISIYLSMLSMVREGYAVCNAIVKTSRLQSLNTRIRVHSWMYF